MRNALPRFVLGWALGIFCADRAAAFIGPESLRIGCAVLACLGIGAAALGVTARHRLCVYGVAVALGGYGLATQRSDAVWSLPEARIEVVIEATIARVTDFGPSFRLDLEGVRAIDPRPIEGSVPPRVQMYVRSPAPGFRELVPGDRLRTRVRLRRVVGRSNPGSVDPAERLRRGGVGGFAAPVSPDLWVRISATNPWARLRRSFHRQRADVSRRLIDANAALPAALALGDRAGLDEEDQEALRGLGLAHLLAVSGLHVALVGGLAFSIARRVLLWRARGRLGLDPRRAAWVAAWSAALLYGIVTGWGVPVQRAWIFGAGLGVGFMLRRSGSQSAPLAVAGWLVLAVDPAALFDPGAQLSFAAAAALQAARRPEAAPAGRLRGLSESLSVSAIALAATAPLAAWHFGRAAPIALVTNLVAVPFTGAVLLPGSLIAAAAALVPGAPGASWGLDTIGAASQALLGVLREAASQLPAEASRSRASGVGVLAAAGCAVFVVRASAVRARLFWALAGAVALAAVPPVSFAPGPPRALVLDVGQGDATLVQGRDSAILVDAGGVGRGRTVVLPALRAAGIRRLDLVVLTHADLDHRGGFLEVLGGVDVARLWVPLGAGVEPAFVPLLAAARSAGTRVEERGAGDLAVRVGDLLVVPLWPPRCERTPGRPGCRGSGRNDRSLVVRIDAASTRILFPGDLERAGEFALLESEADVRADVLRVPHHGSRSSSSREFLEAVSPALALASAPCLGRFEMPAPEVAMRLRTVGAALSWTGPSGALVVGLGPARELRPWRAAPLDFCG